MNLDDLGVIWGIEINSAKEYGEMRRYTNMMVAFATVLVFHSAISIMRSQEVTFGFYFQTMLLLVGLTYVVHGLRARDRLYKVYRFYKTYKKYEVRRMIIRLTEEDVYDAVYATVRTRLKANDTVENYIKLVYDSCARQDSYGRRFLKNLLKLDRVSGEGILFNLYYIEKGKHKYFVGLDRMLVNPVSDEALIPSIDQSVDLATRGISTNDLTLKSEGVSTSEQSENGIVNNTGNKQ